jgi:DNA-binding response OmpR family regulator
MGTTPQPQESEPNRAATPANASGVVFVGPVDGAQRDAEEAAAREAGASPSFCWDVEEASTLLADAKHEVPRCVFLHARLPDCEEFVAWMRGEARLFPVPIVVQADAPDEAAFLEAHAMGADDAFVRGDGRRIQRRLANLAGFDPAARPPLTQGGAVVAHADESRRRILGRILRQAGFDVSFALDTDDLVRGLEARGGEPPSLVVAHADQAPDEAAKLVGRLRAVAGCAEVAIVMVSSQEKAPEIQAALSAIDSTALAFDSAPPDNLLFLANELLRPDVKNVRASARLLHGALCGFRAAGSLEPTYGLSYNISREGLYIRSLDPPAPGASVWFELRPPGRTAAVHLRGKVVWCRGLRNPGGAAPPGFGLRISEQDSPPSDLADYIEAYEQLC